MASWVLSECGLRPLPQIYRVPRTSLTSNSINLPKLKQPKSFAPLLGVSGGLRERKWGLNVSVPLRVASAEEEERESGNLGNEGGFDPAAPPPFKLADIRAAIPKHCWEKNPWKSMSYVVRDVAVVFGLAAAAAYLNNWAVWPLYWFAQSTMFWALFVLGHDWY